MRITARAAFRLCGVLCLLCLFLAGCSGSADVTLIPLGYRTIEAQAPLVYEFQAPEAYFWITEENEVRIGIRDQRLEIGDDPEIIPLEISFILPGIPASGARDYQMTRNTVRGKLSRNMQHVRFASMRGVVSIWVDSDKKIHGRFRTETRYQSFNVLIGWKGGAPVLVLGEFNAVLDSKKTEAIIKSTEAGGMERKELEPVIRRVAGPTPRPQANQAKTRIDAKPR